MTDRPVASADMTLLERPSARSFAQAAEAALARLQTELRGLLQRIPGARTPTDLRDALGIPYNLSWRVLRTVGAATALEAGPFAPSHASIKTLIRAARSHKILPPGSMLAEASEQLQALIDARAGGRATFDTMVSAITGADAERHNAELKRSAFRINCQIMGKLIDATLWTLIVAPDPADVRFVRIAVLGAFIGFQRLRHDASLRITRASHITADGVSLGREPLDPDEPNHLGMGLLSRFCSDPLPDVEIVEEGDAVALCFTTPDLGIDSGVDLFYGYVSRGTADEPTEMLSLITRTPTRVQIQDLFVHSSLYDHEEVALDLFADRSRSDRLPIPEVASRIGRGRWTTRCPEISRYGEVADFVFGRMGWDIEEFNLFRCRIEHPMLQSCTQMWIEYDSDSASA